MQTLTAPKYVPGYARPAGKADTSGRLEGLATGLIALIFVLISGGIEGATARYISPNFGNPLALSLSFSACLLSLPLALSQRPVAMARTVLANWPTVLLLLWAWMSFYWSVDREATLRALLQMSALTLAGMAIATSFSWRTIWTGMACGGLALGVISVLTLPFGGIMTEIHPGALRGIWLEKNVFGEVMSVGVFACAVCARASRSRWYIAGAVFLLTLLVLSKSSTSLLACMTGLAVLGGVEWLGGGRRRFFFGLWTGVLALMGLGFIIAIIGTDATGIVGKDSTFTGRTLIWPSVMRFIEATPWLGHGYQAFWSEGSTYMARVWMEAGFEAQNAHNSFLEMLLGLGLPGLCLLILSLVRMVWQGASGVFEARGVRRFAVAFAMIALLIGLTESAISGDRGFLLFALLILMPKVALGARKA